MILLSVHKGLEAADHRCLWRILNISWQEKLRNERVHELTGQDQLLSKIREHRLDFGGGVTYNGWRMEVEQNNHARTVYRASPGMTTLRKTLRIVEWYGKRPFSWWPTSKNGGVGLPMC